MEPGGKTCGVSCARRMRELRCYLTCLVTQGSRLFCVAQMPKHNCPEAEAANPGIVPIQQGIRAMLVEIIKRDSFFEVFAGGDEIAEPGQVVAHSIMGDNQKRRVFASRV